MLQFSVCERACAAINHILNMHLIKEILNNKEYTRNIFFIFARTIFERGRALFLNDKFIII